MSVKKLFSYLSITFLLTTTSWSQNDSITLIQLSGVVVSADSLIEMPFAAIYNKSTKRGVISDSYGFFSIVVHPSDTLMFRYFNHKPSFYIIPDTLNQKRYSIIHMLEIDTMEIDEVIIYPWPSKEAFAQAFIEMNPYEDQMLRAQRLLSGKSLEQLALMVGGDGSLSYGTITNANNTRLYTLGQSPVNNLMNPASWASFLQKWRAGDLKRQ